MEEAWTISQGGNPNIILAFPDSGVDTLHPDLKNNLLPGYNAVTDEPNGYCWGESHGTNCMGVAIAQGNNEIGVIGGTYRCKALPIVTGYHEFDTTTYERVARALNWAKERADIISLSCYFTETNVLNGIFEDATTTGRNNLGCVIVKSAGNSGNPTVTYPGSRQNLITVGSIDKTGRKTNFSNYGPDLDVVCPGDGIWTTDVPGRVIDTNGNLSTYYCSTGGTSISSPLVASICALILDVRPDLTGQEVRDIIESTAQKIRTDLYTYAETPNRDNGL
jgi:hypothetical protein